MAHITDKQLDAKDFINRVVESYNHGTAEMELEANAEVARSIIPAATGAFRDFSYIAPEIPEFIAENCVGCMDCVTECPDTAILAKVIPDDTIEKSMATHSADEKQQISKHWAKTQKYYELPVKKGQTGGKFGIFIDPTKCKGCAECVTVCGPQKNALKMIPKNKEVLDEARLSFKFYKQETPQPTTIFT
jgi:ferredoxin